MRWPLFTGGLRTSQLRRAHAQWWEAVEQLRQKRLQVASEVRRAIVDVVNAQEQVKLQRMNLDSATENRRIVRTEYAAGKASLVRLNEAQRDFVQTEAELARARIRLRLAWSQLHSAAGYYAREGTAASPGPLEPAGDAQRETHHPVMPATAPHDQP